MTETKTTEIKEEITRSNDMLYALKNKLREEAVFTASLALALVTSFFSFPKLHYIDWKVLVSLFNLMAVIVAFEKLKILDRVSIHILSRYQSERKISLVLVFLTFTSAMLITNDVALITFVPITLILARKAGFDPAYIVILQTIGANIGSSLTPMGNPQNLFLFSFYNIPVGEFFLYTLPLVLLGGLWFLLLHKKDCQKPY